MNKEKLDLGAIQYHLNAIADIINGDHVRVNVEPEGVYVEPGWTVTVQDEDRVLAIPHKARCAVLSRMPVHNCLSVLYDETMHTLPFRYFTWNDTPVLGLKDHFGDSKKWSQHD